jgi:uncharacterized membrane protein
MTIFGWVSVILGVVAWLAAFTRAGTSETYFIIWVSLGCGIIHFLLSRNGYVARHNLAWIGIGLSGSLLLIAGTTTFLYG